MRGSNTRDENESGVVATHHLVIVFDVRHETAELHLCVCGVHAPHDRTVVGVVHRVDEGAQCDGGRLQRHDAQCKLRSNLSIVSE